MELFKTTIFLNKQLYKELKKVLRTPLEKRIFLIMFSILVSLFILAIITRNFRLGEISILLFPSLLYVYFIMPAWKIMRLSRIIQTKRSYSGIKSKEYGFITSFGEIEFKIKDLLDYKGNTLMTIEYDSIHWVTETETFFVILTGDSVNKFSEFGVVNKISIEETGQREEFLQFISSNCSRVKIDEEI